MASRVRVPSSQSAKESHGTRRTDLVSVNVEIHTFIFFCEGRARALAVRILHPTLFFVREKVGEGAAVPHIL